MDYSTELKPLSSPARSSTAPTQDHPDSAHAPPGRREAWVLALSLSLPCEYSSAILRFALFALLQIGCSCPECSWRISKHPQSKIASMTKPSSPFARCMVVVEVCGSIRQPIPANLAQLRHWRYRGIVPLLVWSSSFPFPIPISFVTIAFPFPAFYQTFFA